MREPYVVLVGEGDVGCLGGLQEGEEIVSGVSGGRKRGQDAEAAGEAMSVVLEDLWRAVAGTVVTREDGDAGQRLSKDGVDLFAQEALAVVGGEQDLNVRRGQKAPRYPNRRR